MVEQVDTSVPSNVPEINRQIFEECNKVRANPQSIIPFLQEMLGNFDGVYLNWPGRKKLIHTHEGAATVQEAIEYLKMRSLFPCYSGMQDWQGLHVTMWLT